MSTGSPCRGCAKRPARGPRPPVEGGGAIFRQPANAEAGRIPDHEGMPQPRIKRYALIATPAENGIRRFHLARVAHGSRTAMPAERLERMEEIAAREREERASRNPPR
jgi:hypothetical protein